MNTADLHTRYLKLLELSWKYRTYTERWLSSKASADRDKMNKAKRELDAFMKGEKAALQSKQQEIFN